MLASRSTSSVLGDHMIVIRRKEKHKGLFREEQRGTKRLSKKVKIVHVFLWLSMLALVVPFLSWLWAITTFFEHPDTFATLTMKYACVVICTFEMSFLIAFLVLGILRLVTLKHKKAVRRIRLTADIATGIFVAHLLVYLPMSAFIVTRYKSRIYDEMKLTIRTTRDFEKRDEVWMTTQTHYSCCGADGPKDWEWVNKTATMSCCRDEKNCTKDKAFKSGCYAHERAMLDLYFLIVGLPTLAYQLILTVLMFYGFSSYRISSKKIRMEVRNRANNEVNTQVPEESPMVKASVEAKRIHEEELERSNEEAPHHDDPELGTFLMGRTYYLPG